MKIKSLFYLLVSAAFLALAGCGDGGGSAGGNNDQTPIPSPNSGLLKISTAGTPGTIGAIDMTVDFPAGMTVKTDADGTASTGVVTISGAAASGGNNLALAKFTAATATTKAQLRIGLINSTGFGLGEVATIKFDRDTGVTFPTVAEFPVTGFTASGVDGAPLTGITVAPVSLGAGG